MRNQNHIQNSPEAIYTCDALGVIKSYNKAAIKLWGREPVAGKDEWCGSWKIFNKDGSQLSMDKHPMSIALKEGRLVFGEELILQRPDGSIKHINPYASPLVNAQGRLTGVVSLLREVSAKKEKENHREDKYKNFIEQASDAILIYSFDGTIHEFNDSCCKLSGYTREEYARLKLSDILVGDLIINQENYALIIDKKATTLIRQFKRKDKVLLDLEIKVKMLEDGKVIAFGRDITERLKTEKALQQSEIFNQSILSSITSHIAVVEESGNIISVNKAWNDFSEGNCECQLERTGVGSNYIKVCERAAATGDVLAIKSLAGFYKVLNREIPIFEMEYPCHSQHEKRWFLLRITKFADDSPKVVMMHIDISERVKAAESMHEALERHDILTMATSDTIWDWDIVNNKMTYNDVITKMFGYESLGTLKNIDWWKSKIHPDDMERVMEAVEKAFKEQLENFQLEYRFRCADDTYKYVYDRSFTIFDSSGKPCRMIGAMQDITERKQAQNQFEAMKRSLMNQKVQEQKKITRAILNAQEKERRHMGEELHDNINQMLAGTKLYLSVVGNGNTQLKEAIKYPIQLIDDTMNEIRLLTKRSTTPKQNINLKELIHSLLEALDKNTGIKTSFDYNVASDFNDDDLKLNIYRILQEQTNNIMKHAEAVNVSITLETKSNVIYVEVKDDGKGFKVNKKSEGIGLANIVNRAESFNGKVLIQSAPGKGCKLELTIPY